ncbi:hypothetical protein MBLNU230_g1021t1 [Neophaeotheca triangularis]
MAAGPEPAYELQCSCNQYPWGMKGSNSISARLCEKSGGWDGKGPQDKKFKIDENTPYAEMWMGTYPVLPSYVKATGQDLQEVLDNYPKETIGEKVIAKFGHSKLPYLPKVLSIAKALPLQVHPNTELSSKLHQERPSAFTDPNHKPEIALALGDFEAFVGFKPLEQVAKLIELEPLKQFLPNSQKPFDDQQLKEVTRQMLLADEKQTKEAVKNLGSISADKFGPDTYIPKLIPRLVEQYDETDNGILVALVCMNYLTLKAGEGLYIPADGIHAYLSGDIIECMARSNNVLNTGFCPRPDRNNVDLFTSTLSFNPHNPKDCMLPTKPYQNSTNGKTTRYMPALSEFDMLQTTLQAGEKETLKAAGGPSILLATKGGASMKCNGTSYDLTEGKVFFVSHGVEIELDSKDGLLMHTAFVE